MSNIESTASASTSVSVDALFESVPFGSVTLPNRIVMAPMTRSFSPGKVPGQDVADYYRRRTEGGVGLIITEGVNPGHPSCSADPNVPQLEGEAALAGWKRVVDAVHEAGGFIIPQIWHVGSVRKKGTEPHPDVPGFGPSAITHPSVEQAGKTQIPHEMTQDDIDEVIASFALAAKNAKEVGFDGLEIHGAHSYLVDQFFWEATNKRTDAYGGDTLPERMRFAVELVRAVREAVGPEFPIVFRFSQWKQGDYTHKMIHTPDELKTFLDTLVEAGVDIFHASQRRFNDPEFEGSTLNLAGWCKKLTGKPVMTVGSVGLDSDFLRSFAGKSASKAGLNELVQRVEASEFEFVAVGRALISDPAWANKVRDGQEDQIVEFTSGSLKELH